MIVIYIVSVTKFQTFNGRKYWLNNTGRYYSGDHYEDGKRIKVQLHRVVWEHYSDKKIPKGYCVHHVNGNTEDNSFENLEIMPIGKHASMHMRDRLKSKKYREKNKKDLMIAREKANEWHKSAEGRKWHSEHGKECWSSDNRKKLLMEKICTVCGEKYDSYMKWSKFCSKKCALGHGYHSGRLDEKRKCERCDKEFTCYKYKKTKCCSRSCGANLRWNK